jgi:hypothetical protein
MCAENGPIRSETAGGDRRRAYSCPSATQFRLLNSHTVISILCPRLGIVIGTNADCCVERSGPCQAHRSLKTDADAETRLASFQPMALVERFGGGPPRATICWPPMMPRSSPRWTHRRRSSALSPSTSRPRFSTCPRQAPCIRSQFDAWLRSWGALHSTTPLTRSPTCQGQRHLNQPRISIHNGRDSSRAPIRYLVS